MIEFENNCLVCLLNRKFIFGFLHAYTGVSSTMKNLISLIIIIFFPYFGLDAQTLFNNGAFIRAQNGAFISISGSVKNNNLGILNIEGDGISSNAVLKVSQDVINNATINANGFIRLNGDWIDNNMYASTTGTVFFEGANQILGGTAATIFFNLTLDGSGVKTQTINKYANGVLDLKSLQLNTDIYSFYVNNTSTNSIIRTSGFVSSANGGFLSRKTSSNAVYLFPVGSNANSSANIPGSGTSRFRPVQIIPNDALTNTYSVRMANVNATTEFYDLNLTDADFCTLNPLFYHQINRSFGTSSADIIISFDATTDGIWEGLARWNITSSNLWQKILNSSVVSGSPYSLASKLAWSNFNFTPYILYNNKPIVQVSCNNICLNQLTPISANVESSGVFAYSWTTPINYNPNPGNVSSFNAGLGGDYCVTVTNTITNCVSDPTCCSFSVSQPPMINAISPP